jgi:hypothetical protein
MTDIPDNPPAFPVADCDTEGRTVFQGGMTLRDYFAAAALQGMLASMDEAQSSAILDQCAKHKKLPQEVVAATAYRQADAMLKARAV